MIADIQCIIYGLEIRENDSNIGMVTGMRPGRVVNVFLEQLIIDTTEAGVTKSSWTYRIMHGDSIQHYEYNIFEIHVYCQVKTMIK